jgi:DNA-directed RNA polymerase subunit omega
MARITVEDCLEHVTNRFELVRLTARRAKQLLAGDTTVTDSKGNKAIVSALREVADGKVRFAPQEENLSDDIIAEEIGHDQLGDRAALEA